MWPKGEIYARGKSMHGIKQIALSEEEKKRYQIFRYMGAVLASLSISSFIFFWGPGLNLDIDFVVNREVSRKTIAESFENIPTPIPETKKEKENNEQKDFSISIPVINAESVVIKEVDPFDEPSYLDALSKGIAHARGTGLPGEGRRIYLFAHSTNSPLNFARYNAIFYQLGKLVEGDVITAKFGEDEINYIVKDIKIVEATDTHWLTENGDHEELVLQTCDPPGTTLRRLLVFAEPIS